MTALRQFGHFFTFVAIGSLAGFAQWGFAEQGPSQQSRAPRWFDYRTSYCRFDAETLKRFGEVGVHIVNFHPFNVLNVFHKRERSTP
jgi:hypothetical protein